MKLICKCGNASKFTVSVKEYHTWAVDGSGDFVSNLGSDDHDKSDDYQCSECDSYDVQVTNN